MINKFVSDNVSSYLSFMDMMGIARLFITGKLNQDKVFEFEKRFADYIGVKHAIALSSGRSALYLCLKYYKSLYMNSPGEVLLSAYNFFAIPSIIRLTGFSPKYIDASDSDFNIDITKIKEAINENTVGIIVTHIYGMPADIEAIMDIAKNNNLFVIEDSAHAIGSEVNKRKVGSFGNAAFFSFSLTKMITTFSGGMLVTDNMDIYKFCLNEFDPDKYIKGIRLFKELAFGAVAAIFTSPKIYNMFTYYIWYLLNKIFGRLINRLTTEEPAEISKDIILRRLTPAQSVIGMINLGMIEELLNARSANTEKIITELSGLDIQMNNALKETFKSNNQNIAVSLKDLNRIRMQLLDAGIDARKSYIINCGDAGKYNIAERLKESVLLIPNHNKYLSSEIKILAEKVKKIIENREKNEVR